MPQKMLLKTHISLHFWIFPSYRHQSIDLQCKSFGWCLYDGNVDLKWINTLTLEVSVFSFEIFFPTYFRQLLEMFQKISVLKSLEKSREEIDDGIHFNITITNLVAIFTKT